MFFIVLFSHCRGKFMESDFVALMVNKHIRIEYIQSKSYSRKLCDYYQEFVIVCCVRITLCFAHHFAVRNILIEEIYIQ